MNTQSIVRWFMGAALLALPSTSFATATNIQDIHGGAGVSMNYASGIDEFLVNDFDSDSHLIFNIYQSETPAVADSWVLDRTYTEADFPEINQDYYYDLYSAPAIQYKGDWYFVSRASSLGEGATVMEQIDVWRITARGEKPEVVFSSDNDYTNYYDGLHMPLAVFSNNLAFMDSTGAMYGTTDGITWSGPGQVTMLDGTTTRNDFVSNGTTAFLSIAGTVYKSTDLDTWIDLGDLCADSTADACSVDALITRPGHGVIAVVNSRNGDTYTNQLMVYKRSNWVVGDTFAGSIAGIERFGRKLIMAHSGSDYFYKVSRITSNGRLQNLVRRRVGTAMGVLAKRYVLINKPLSEYVTIMRYALN